MHACSNSGPRLCSLPPPPPPPAPLCPAAGSVNGGFNRWAPVARVGSSAWPLLHCAAGVCSQVRPIRCHGSSRCPVPPPRRARSKKKSWQKAKRQKAREVKKRKGIAVVSGAAL